LDNAMLTFGAALWAIGAVMGEGVAVAGALVCLLSTKPRLGAGAVLLVLFVASGVAMGALWQVEPVAPGSFGNALYLLAFPAALRIGGDRGGLRGLALCLLAASAALAWGQQFTLIDYPSWLAEVLPPQRVQEPAPIGGYMAGGLHFHRLRYAHTFLFLGVALFGNHRSVEFVCGALLCLWAIVPSFASGALLALGAGTLAAALAHAIGPWLRAATCGVAFAIAGALPYVLPQHAAWPADRQVAWLDALRIWQEHLVWGVGVGNYPHYAARVAELPYIHLDAHATLLQVLVERGVVGAACFAILAVLWLRALHPLRPATVGVFVAACALGVVHNLAFHPGVFVALAFATALANPRAADP
jgi:hypothetical protein